MADHSELVKEMVELEKMSSQDRLKLAKKRRQSQLKKYSESEKKHDKQEKQSQKRKTKAMSMLNSSTHHTKGNSLPQPARTTKIHFDKGVMLLEAAARNDVSEVRALLEDGVNPDVANEDGLTALHQCCIDDSEDMLLLLLEHGANVNSRDSELWTPLHAAATCAHLRICQHLLSKSADLLAVNADGNMPYDICDDEETLEYIETQMAGSGITQDLIDETRFFPEKNMLDDIKQFEGEGHPISSWKDRTGATMLHVAAANGYSDVVSYLLSRRLDVNVTDNDGWTPVMAAACWGQIPVLEILAKNGADLERKTKDNKTLVDLVDDMEVKDQITEIKQEIKVNTEKFRRANSDTRRRSSTNIRSSSTSNGGGASAIYNSNTSLPDKNPFSSSVRRHSMREKHRLSMREARDEARFRISINTNDDDSSAPTSPDEPAPLLEDQKNAGTMPVTNIDDVGITVSENNVTTINISEPTQPVSDQSSSPDTPTDEAQAEKKKLVATISLSGDGPEPSPNPSPTAPPRKGRHMNGDRNSNGNVATAKPGILKHTSDSGEAAGVTDKSTENNSNYQQSSTPSSTGNPTARYQEPPTRRYTAHGAPIGGSSETKQSKNCCTIL